MMHKWIIFFGRWVAARISEIFLCKEYGKWIFFYKETKSNKKKILAVGRGEGGGVARVSDFFFFFKKNPRLKKKIVFFFRGWR